MADEERTPAAAVVLAAGEGRRFGAQKLLMPFGDSTVLGCVLSALSGAGVQPIIVVVGADAAVADWLESLAGQANACGVRIARNPDPGRGMLSSVCTGVSALPPDVERFVIALGDQPAVRRADISHLLSEHAQRGKGIALPTYRGKRGHPAVFAGRYRELIMALDDTMTLRDLTHAHRDDVAEVECQSDAVLRDLDTREQYQDELRRSDS